MPNILPRQKCSKSKLSFTSWFLQITSHPWPSTHPKQPKALIPQQISLDAIPRHGNHLGKTSTAILQVSRFQPPNTTQNKKNIWNILGPFPKNPSQMPRRWWYVFCFDFMKAPLGREKRSMDTVRTREKIHGHWILPPWRIGLTFASPGIRGDLPRQISHGGCERLLKWLVLPNFACHNYVYNQYIYI